MRLELTQRGDYAVRAMLALGTGAMMGLMVAVGVAKRGSTAWKASLMSVSRICFSDNTLSCPTRDVVSARFAAIWLTLPAYVVSVAFERMRLDPHPELTADSVERLVDRSQAERRGDEAQGAESPE